MDIAIDQLSIQLGPGIAPGRAQAIGALIEAALQAELRAHASEFVAAPAGYSVPLMETPLLHVRSTASDVEIARMVAGELARAILLELEV